MTTKYSINAIHISAQKVHTTAQQTHRLIAEILV